MKNIIIVFICLTCFNLLSQNSSTFYVSKKSDNDVKKVFTVGDKVSIELIDSSSQTHIVKGEITTILADRIIIDSTAVLLSQIQIVSAHNWRRKFVGILLTLGGTAYATFGRRTAGGTYSEIGELVITMIGLGIAVPSAMILVVLPHRFSSDKFAFNTYIKILQ